LFVNNEDLHKCSSHLDTLLLKISYELTKNFKLGSLAANHLAMPGLQDFFKKVSTKQLFRNTQ